VHGVDDNNDISNFAAEFSHKCEEKYALDYTPYHVTDAAQIQSQEQEMTETLHKTAV